MSRRFPAMLLFLLLAAASASGQSDSIETVQQTLIPKDVYVGDTARLRYTFRSPVDFFALASPECVTSDGISLDTTKEPFSLMEQSCTVERAVVERTESAYTLVVTFIPWEPGQIDFSPFDLNEACGISQEQAVLHVIDIEPVVVSSLSQKLGVTSLRGPASPKTIPGTSYVIWAFIIAALVVLVLLVILLLHLSDFLNGMAGFFERLGFLRNAALAKRGIRRLLSKKLTDAEFSQSWQHVMRSYLEYRFSVPFLSVTGDRVRSVISDATGGFLQGAQDEAVEDIASFFVRTDYICYAGGSLDSAQVPVEEHGAEFRLGEKKDMAAATIRAIDTLEKHIQEPGGKR